MLLVAWQAYFQTPSFIMHEGETKSTSKLMMLQIATMLVYKLLYSKYSESKPKT
jgi:hypothetical protein